jgi:RNA polymerase sigma-70 factor (ECF subfamily)
VSSALTTTGLAAAVARSAGRTAQQHAALYERILERIHGYFRRLIHDPAEAEECTQRTFLELERSLKEAKYEAGRSFNTWMWMKAHKVFVAWCREREKRLRARPIADDPDPADEAAASADADGGPASSAAARGAAPSDPVDHRARTDEKLDAETVLGAVRQELGAEVLECFVLRYEGGLTLEEVAEAVGRARKTVAGRIAKAHELIDRLLKGPSPEPAP